MAVEARGSTGMISVENFTMARTASVANAPGALSRDHRVANAAVKAPRRVRSL
jgi:hypothetical protein